MTPIEQIHELLEATRLPREDLAAAYGVSGATVTRYLNEDRGMPPEFAEWAIRYLQSVALSSAGRALAVGLQNKAA